MKSASASWYSGQVGLVRVLSSSRSAARSTVRFLDVALALAARSTCSNCSVKFGVLAPRLPRFAGTGAPAESAEAALGRVRDGAGVQVGRILGLARHVRPERGLGGGLLGGLGADQLERDRAREGLLGPSRRRCRSAATTGCWCRRRRATRKALAVGVARAALAGDAGEPVAGLLVDLLRPGRSAAGTSVFDHGMTTLLKQDESARASSKNGTVALASAASSGIVGRRSLTRPRSSGLETSCAQLADERVGVVERLVAAWTPGSASRANARSCGEGGVELGQRRAALGAAPGQLGDRLLERLALGREGAGDDPEVGDEVLELLLVAVERLDRGRRGCG